MEHIRLSIERAIKALQDADDHVTDVEHYGKGTKPVRRSVLKAERHLMKVQDALDRVDAEEEEIE